jgi:hypothetical protein
MSHHATPGSISKTKDGTEKMTEEILEEAQIWVMTTEGMVKLEDAIV